MARISFRTIWFSLAVVVLILLAAPVWAQEQATPAPPRSVETALGAVAAHLSPPYALYLYESLTRQVLSNDRILEQPQSPRHSLASDSLWALDIISKSILREGQDGQYLDVRLVPSFFKDIVRRYMNASHYWPEREITPDNRREHLAAWYSIYLMLLVGNAAQDEVAATLRNGAFELDPGQEREMLEAGGPSLVDRLKREKVLTEETYKLVHIRRRGPAGGESLTFPAYLDRWKAKIYAAYGLG
jgi:hypothetical protein